MDHVEGQKARAVADGAREQLLGVQALRFIAAFAVVVLHCSFYTVERLTPSLGIYNLGANGVRLFFVISGFVMVASSHRLEGTPYGWRVFAFKRLVRIVPMYWAITTVKLAMLLAVPAVVLHSQIDWSFIAKSYAFIPAINKDGEIHPLLGVGWTLNFEMFFYLLFALALAWRMPPLRLIAPVLCGLTLLSLFRSPEWPVPLQFWADPVVMDFLAGMLIARAAQKRITLPSPAAWACVIVGLAYLFIPMPRPGVYGSVQFSLSFTIAAALVVAGTVELEEKIRPLIPGWLSFMGAASYALYLIHPILAPIGPTLLKRLAMPYPILSIAISITVALIAGICTYLFIEQPLTRRLNSAVRGRGLYDPAPESTMSRPQPAGGGKD